MEFIFYKPKPFESMKPYNFTYDGYRSKFFKTGMDPQNPPSSLLPEAKESVKESVKESENEKIKELIRLTFPVIAFETRYNVPHNKKENNIIEVETADRFEDLAVVQKKKYLISLNPQNFLCAVCSIFLNLCKGGVAIVSLPSSSPKFGEEMQSKNEEEYDLINLLACNFEQTKINKEVIILEKFSEKYKKQALKYLHFLFDAQQPIKLFLEPQNKKLQEFFSK